jgi:periplasmic protein TonB
MSTLTPPVDHYAQAQGTFRLRGGVAAAVVLAHMGAIAWLLMTPAVPELPEAGAMQMVFIAPPQAESPPPPQPKVEQPPVLAARRQVQAAPEAPAIPPEPVETAPAEKVSDEVAAPAQPAAPEAVPAPVEVPVNVRAAYANNPQPGYPAASRRLNERGLVRLRALVGNDGRVQQIVVESSSGYNRLDNAAMEAVRDWKFAPARRGDAAIAQWVIVPINFNLVK